jgi:type I restriction enzyme S subunit
VARRGAAALGSDTPESNVDKKAYGDESPIKLCNYTDVYYNDTITEDMEFMDATASEEQITKFSLRAGDTILTKDSETADDIAISAYVPRDLPGVVCGYHLSMVRPFESTHGAFIKWLFDSHFMKAQTEVSANGLTRVGLGQYALDNIWLALPLLKEQSCIERFLAQESRKIDALVEEQRRLIELLKEKRQAVISHAVTKGLNPDAPMKDSGVEWIGQLPEHWPIRKLSQLFRAGKGKNGQLLTKEYCGDHEGDYPVYSGQTENDGIMATFDEFEFDFGSSGVLFSTTVGAKAMHLKQLYGRFNLSQNCMIIWPTFTDCKLRYFYYHLQPLFQFQRGLIPEHMQASFRVEDLYEYQIAVPPVLEQASIAEFLDRETNKIDELTSEATHAIDLLQERRTALISAAVTGKIDVRGLSGTEAA